MSTTLNNLNDTRNGRGNDESFDFRDGWGLGVFGVDDANSSYNSSNAWDNKNISKLATEVNNASNMVIRLNEKIKKNMESISISNDNWV